MSNRSFCGLSLAVANARPFATVSPSAWRAARTWASICWVFTYAGISALCGWPLLSGRLIISNDPTGDNERNNCTHSAVWKQFCGGSNQCLTLLYEYGLSVISPVFTTVSPLVICLINRSWAHLITYKLTVINENKKKYLVTLPGGKNTTWHPSCAAFWLVSLVSTMPPGGGILPGMLL